MSQIRSRIALLTCLGALVGCVPEKPEDPAAVLKKECIKMDAEIKATTSQMQSAALICSASPESCDAGAKAGFEEKRSALLGSFEAKQCTAAMG